MQSNDLTAAQCRALQDQLCPMLAYLNKLRHRMQNKGFPLDDPLWVMVSQAQARMQDLITELRCAAADAKRRDTLPKYHDQPKPDRNQRRGE